MYTAHYRYKKWVASDGKTPLKADLAKDRVLHV